MKRNITVINGPNLNVLHLRESVYGGVRLDDINAGLAKRFPGAAFTFFQSNSEGALIDQIQKQTAADGVIINAGAYSHYSHAIRDALAILKCPIVEVHVSNLWARPEEFRHTSVISPVCRGVISGFGPDSYRLAVEALINLTT
ncbi:3-dehydroquinate dehydratase [Clostridia bacterium]|nr:3-dehydroquinate dehydratase [Clostridia bacterium]